MSVAFIREKIRHEVISMFLLVIGKNHKLPKCIDIELMLDVNVEQPKFDRNNGRSVNEAIRFPLFLLLLRDIRLQKEMLTFSNK